MHNVMMVDNEPMLIDMETLGLGNPVFDMAGLYATYQLFKQDDPRDSMEFLGMSDETVDEIWREKSIVTDRIALAARIRFLYIIETTELKYGEMGRKRIDHAASHIEELLQRVTKLSIP